MYAGTTIRRGSGRIVGVHQKIDRAARRHLKPLLPELVYFPAIKEILSFEGNNGPDGIKRKSPSVDEPEHYIDPNDPTSSELITIINDHIFNLAKSLKSNNQVRASFEAAWLAHSVVDGLTPPHHYPVSEKIAQLWSDAKNERDSVINRNIIVGDGLRDTLSKNWEYWGPGGVITAHGIFEIGVASAISTEYFRNFKINKRDITKLQKIGFETFYLESVKKVFDMKMYEELSSTGWTQRFAKQVRTVLIPEMIKMVVLAWYESLLNAKKI